MFRKSILILSLLISLPSFAKRRAKISNHTKMALYNKVIDDIWFEDEGSSRTIKYQNLKFRKLKTRTRGISRYKITGTQANDWDQTEVSYNCRGVVKKVRVKSKSIHARGKKRIKRYAAASCKLRNENWPKADSRLSFKELEKIVK